MLDLLLQDLELRVECVVTDIDREKICEHALDPKMFFKRFEKDIFGPLGLHSRIEVTLFNGGMHCELVSDVVEQRLLRSAIVKLFNLREEVLDLSVLSFEQARLLLALWPS